MGDRFLETEWDDLGRRVRRTAEHCGAQVPGRAGRFREQAEEFCRQPPPDSYPALLERVRQAAALAVSWQSERPSESDRRAGGSEPIDPVVESSLESFPASDPPTWTSAAITPSLAVRIRPTPEEDARCSVSSEVGKEGQLCAAGN